MNGQILNHRLILEALFQAVFQDNFESTNFCKSREFTMYTDCFESF